MATYNKFQDFVEQLVRGLHDFDAHTFKIYLSNEAPLATDTVKTDIAEISAGNGYTAGGQTTTIGLSESGGTLTATATDVNWTASGGNIGPFRYAILYNDTDPSDRLIAWWDNGSGVTLSSGQSFTVDFGASLFTLV